MPTVNCTYEKRRLWNSSIDHEITEAHVLKRGQRERDKVDVRELRCLRLTCSKRFLLHFPSPPPRCQRFVHEEKPNACFVGVRVFVCVRRC